jgi:hypothetical protein
MIMITSRIHLFAPADVMHAYIHTYIVCVQINPAMNLNVAYKLECVYNITH